MNDTMPQGRVFGMPPPVVPPTPPPVGGPGSSDEAGRPARPWLVPLLAALGGAAGGAALAVGVLVLLAAVALDEQQMPELGAPLGLGEPLGAEITLAGEMAQVVPPDSELVVDVAGAVERPGLHRLRPGDRVGDAIEAAGGYAPRVDLAAASEVLNLAQPLEDGTKVLVPELGIDRVDAPASEDGRIDLNAADQAALETLPGVGPVTARKIIEARAGRRFSSVQDLRSRGLVGDAVLEDITPLVRVG